MIRLLALLLVLAAPALALEPERREVTVISTRVWDGYRYEETFLPSTIPTLTLMSGQASAITFARTEEYYWPLSRKVHVDFERRRDPLSGVLRIEQGGAVVAELALKPFAIRYPDGAINGNGSLLWGDAALQGYAAHRQAEIDFNRRFVAVQQEHAAYERALLEEEVGAARVPGTRVAVIPPPPPLPTPSLALVTRPDSGFRIDLAPGRYRIALIDGGREVAGTVRDLDVIDASGRAALVADIVPEERWTRPLAADSDAARIYARAGSTFYLTLSEATRFEASEYLPVVSPQAVAVPGQVMWVRRKPSPTRALELRGDDGSTPLQLASLKVEQTGGSGFGYAVRPAKSGEPADLSAFAVRVPNAGAGRMRIVLGDGTFGRDVVIVGPRAATAGLLMALAPAVVALILAVRRRRRFA